MNQNDEIIIVRSFPNAYIAEIAKGVLETFGIQSFIRKSIMEDSMIASGTMQIADLCVLKKDYERAKKILDKNFKE